MLYKEPDRDVVGRICDAIVYIGIILALIILATSCVTTPGLVPGLGGKANQKFRYVETYANEYSPTNTIEFEGETSDPGGITRENAVVMNWISESEGTKAQVQVGQSGNTDSTAQAAALVAVGDQTLELFSKIAQLVREMVPEMMPFVQQMFTDYMAYKKESESNKMQPREFLDWLNANRGE